MNIHFLGCLFERNAAFKAAASRFTVSWHEGIQPDEQGVFARLQRVSGSRNLGQWAGAGRVSRALQPVDLVARRASLGRQPSPLLATRSSALIPTRAFPFEWLVTRASNNSLTSCRTHVTWYRITCHILFQVGEKK